ncbi:MAG: hypothetical protein K9G42_05910, partial [Pedobacter sp.]|nr:hypothetical protein [Pedobacter sp.]
RLGNGILNGVRMGMGNRKWEIGNWERENSAAFRSIPYLLPDSYRVPIIKKRELKCGTGKDNR